MNLRICNKLLTLLFFMGLSLTYSQPIQTPIIISANNTNPATFIQSSPSLFYDESNGFIVTWEDYRNGDLQYFSQKFNSLSDKVDINFKAITNNFIAYSSNNNSLAIQNKTEIYDYKLGIYEKIFCGYVYDDFYVSPQLELGSFMYTDLVDFWISENYSAVKLGADFLSATDFWDNIQITRTSDNGLTPHVIFSERKNYHYRNTTLAANKKGEYLIAYLNTSYQDTTDGIYIKTFSKTDSIIITKRIKSDNYSKTHPQILALSFGDSLFSIFALDSLKLRNIKIDIHGNIISEKIHEAFPDRQYRYYQNGSITVSNMNNNQRILNITSKNPEISVLFYLNDKNEIISNPIIDSTSNLECNRGIFLEYNGNLITTKTINDNIYLIRSNNFSITDSIKINDDTFGSNDISPIVKEWGNNGFYATWQNEQSEFGRSIDSIRNTIGNIEIIDNNNFSYFNDGTKLLLWKKELDTGKKQIGFTLLNEKLDTTKKIILGDSYESCYPITSIISSIISDSTFVTAYVINSQIYFSKYTKEGILIKANEISNSEFCGSLSTTTIFFDSEFIYLRFPQLLHLYKFDKLLSPISSFDTYYYDLFVYLGNSKFFSAYYDDSAQLSMTFIAILNDSNDVIKTIYDFPFSVNSSNTKIKRIKKNLFLATNGITAYLYNEEWEQIGSPKKVFKLQNMEMKSYDFISNGNNVLFTWSARTFENGNYDIYAATLDIDYLVGVDEKESIPEKITYELKQNYPNPFNPSTVINYQLSKDSFVNLTIYDILGQKIAELVKGHQTTGVYSVKFDGSIFPSGIYMYKLQADDFRSVKKMLLMK